MTLSLSRRYWLAALASTALPLGVALPFRASVAQAPDANEYVLGSPDAKITVIEYASLSCPHCAAFHNEVLPELEKRYVDTGKVKFVFRDFPLDQLALIAAVIAHCGGTERYFSFASAIFASQRGWATSSDPLASLKQIGRLGGLTDEQMDACLADKAQQEAVLQSRLVGEQQFKVDSTPSFFVNGTKYEGEYTVDGFAKAFDALLA